MAHDVDRAAALDMANFLCKLKTVAADVVHQNMQCNYCGGEHQSVNCTTVSRAPLNVKGQTNVHIKPKTESEGEKPPKRGRSVSPKNQNKPEKKKQGKRGHSTDAPRKKSVN